MNKTGKIVNFIVLLAGLAMIGYFLALGIFVRFGQSLSELWLLAGILCVGRFIVWSSIYKTGKYPPKKPVFVLRALFCVALVLFLGAEAIILAGGLTPPEPGLEYIVVLGAKVNGREPSGALRNRIQAAKEYLEANPGAIAILTGGKGSDEEISEAQCMYERLTAGGIDPARLIMEDRATDTSENLIYSRELLPDPNQRAGLVTNNFHIFRTLATARGLGWTEAVGIPVETTMFSMPHYLMREFIGVLYDGVQGHLAF